ncbi:hypothetical protein TBK1r_57570 [Stieleria magnilauensis]|uniref:Uncharacterized protein n=1 Tax=Stieleria magnilauensis TaxID=2527963 RepID=A0ABX5XXJ1_9BACT|nr:hypothetical protein TBK1r_57570 [Planctomycetes bacterium TBK1r]
MLCMPIGLQAKHERRKLEAYATVGSYGSSNRRFDSCNRNSASMNGS